MTKVPLVFLMLDWLVAFLCGTKEPYYFTEGYTTSTCLLLSFSKEMLCLDTPVDLRRWVCIVKLNYWSVCMCM